MGLKVSPAGQPQGYETSLSVVLCNDYGDKNRLIKNISSKLQIVDKVLILSDKVMNDEARVRNQDRSCPFAF